MAYLPMSMRQLERLLSTFSTNSKLRTKLSSPEALDTVLAILEPTEEELTDGSWNWRPTAPAESHETIRIYKQAGNPTTQRTEHSSDKIYEGWKSVFTN